MTRYFYGFEHRYGSNMRDADGDWIGDLYSFPTRAARDAWVEENNSYSNNRGARDAVSAPFARRWERQHQVRDGIEWYRAS